MIRTHVLSSADDLKPEFEQLLHGEVLDKPVYENIAMSYLNTNGDMVWSLLLFSGYLKPLALYTVEDRPWARLTIPNREVYVCLTDLVRAWFNESLGSFSSNVRLLLKALLQGEQDVLHELLQEMVVRSVSFHDSTEAFFHGFVLGLLVNLSEHYEVRSNQESGFGRYDVLVNPKLPGKPGVIIEFKRVKTKQGETLSKALASAMKQLRDRDYASILRERGASPIHQIAIAVEGKEVELEVKTWSPKVRTIKKKPQAKKRATK